MEVPAGQVNFRGSLLRSPSNILEPMLHPVCLGYVGVWNLFLSFFCQNMIKKGLFSDLWSNSTYKAQIWSCMCLEYVGVWHLFLSFFFQNMNKIWTINKSQYLGNQSYSLATFLHAPNWDLNLCSCERPRTVSG